MHTKPHYPAPPIFDAVIELRLQREFDERTFLQLSKKLGSNYASRLETGETDIEVKLEEGKIESQIGKVRPVHNLSSEDQSERCRIEPKKIHWSKLPPYDGWQTFLQRVVRDLEIVTKKSGFLPLERIGVRYRNRIDIPVNSQGEAQYEDYLCLNVRLPSLLDPIDHFSCIIKKRFSEQDIDATISSAVMDPEIPNTIAILLDIDVAASRELPNNVKSLIQKLENLRMLKNDIFESSITDMARKTFL